MTMLRMNTILFAIIVLLFGSGTPQNSSPVDPNLYLCQPNVGSSFFDCHCPDVYSNCVANCSKVFADCEMYLYIYQNQTGFVNCYGSFDSCEQTCTGNGCTMNCFGCFFNEINTCSPICQQPECQTCTQTCQGSNCNQNCFSTGECTQTCGGGGCAQFVSGNVGYSNSTCDGGHCNQSIINGTGSSSCNAGRCEQLCGAGSECNYTCNNGDCSQTCSGISCNVSCSFGSCYQSCLSGECIFSCDGGRCAQLCDGHFCNMSCSEGRCNQTCNQGECFFSCAGGYCTTVFPEQCHQNLEEFLCMNGTWYSGSTTLNISGDLVIGNGSLELSSVKLNVGGNLIFTNAIYSDLGNNSISVGGCVNISNSDLHISVPTTSSRIQILTTNCLIGNFSQIIILGNSECALASVQYLQSVLSALVIVSSCQNGSPGFEIWIWIVIGIVGVILLVVVGIAVWKVIQIKNERSGRFVELMVPEY